MYQFNFLFIYLFYAVFTKNYKDRRVQFLLLINTMDLTYLLLFKYVKWILQFLLFESTTIQILKTFHSLTSKQVCKI